jgi:hypothetical protein
MNSSIALLTNSVFVAAFPFSTAIWSFLSISCGSLKVADFSFGINLRKIPCRYLYI